MGPGVAAAVVVGAHIGGLAAAIGLLGAGWSVTVLERGSAASEIGAGLSLFSNGLSTLEALSVEIEQGFEGDTIYPDILRGTSPAERDATSEERASIGNRSISVPANQ